MHRYPNRLLFVLLALFLLQAGPRLLAQQPFFHADSGSARRTNLGGNVNGAGVELLPIVSPDGKTLYFDRKYHVNNVGGADDEDDIYYSTLGADGKWSPARNIGPPLNTTGSDVLFWISADGRSALVHNGGERDGRKIGLAISTKDASGAWGAPKPITIEGLSSLNALGEGYSATISPDGRRLIIAYSRDSIDTENLDLFSSPARGDDYLRWGPPVPMGRTINTPLYEWAPFIASDNRTLYFASGGQLGFGRSDIFMARRLDDSWERWSDPYNLGATINTNAYEAALSIAPKGDYAYLSASGTGYETNYGKSDIYRVLLPDSMRPMQMVELKGTLKAGGKSIKGSVRLEKMPGGEEVATILSDDNGGFTFLAPAGSEYRLRGWSVGYDEGSQKVDLRKKKSAPAKVTLTLKKQSEAATSSVSQQRRPSSTSTPRRPTADIVRQSAVIIDDFAVGSSELPAAAVAKLQEFVTNVRTIWSGTVIGIEVVGHTDNVGDEGGNQVLSFERAESVKRWLVEKGLDGSTIIAFGRGDAAPIAPNGVGKARAQNRRVEIKILTMKGDAANQ